MGSVHWQDQDTSNCSIGRTWDIMGKPWVLLILREVFRGLHRFDDIRRHLGISEPVLSRRLHGLVEEGVLERRPYRTPGNRTRDEYHLTEAGLELFPLLVALKAWGDRHLAGPEGPATVHEHQGCGRPVVLELRCTADHRLEGVGGVEARSGPAARALARE
ncbi:transcriptional regulator [Nonomuraea phyllanthi]|nr:transcriptional regulator [Nonomuraea phyllanthi]